MVYERLGAGAGGGGEVGGGGRGGEGVGVCEEEVAEVEGVRDWGVDGCGAVGWRGMLVGGCGGIGEGLTSWLLLRWRLRVDWGCFPLLYLYPLCGGSWAWVMYFEL